MKLLQSNLKNVLIKSYLHESGLFYLAQSLGLELEKQGHNVFYIPKAKYVKEEARYVKKYLNSTNIHHNILPMKIDESTSKQIMKYIQDYKINAIISLETLMEFSSWIRSVKKTNIKLIDVPMLEWVNQDIIAQKKYQVFDEIWALTNITAQTFKNYGYRNILNKKWNFVNSNLFFPDPNNWREPGFYFLHQGSLNQEYSSKNTLQVIEAFQMLEKEKKETKLFITGINQTYNDIIKKSNNIINLDRLLSRQEVANLYNNTDCVVAPSSKEGLGLSLYEAQACGCHVITTDVPPMNEIKTPYLCKVSSLKKDHTLVSVAEVSAESIYQQMKKVYEENYVECDN